MVIWNRNKYANMHSHSECWQTSSDKQQQSTIQMNEQYVNGNVDIIIIKFVYLFSI